jgi:hypothetical protein
MPAEGCSMSQVQTYEERLQGHVRAVSDAANSITSHGCKEFAQLLSREHRTIQQSYTRMCVAWLEELAGQKNFDMRNEASVNLGKEFVEKVKERGLPYI